MPDFDVVDNKTGKKYVMSGSRKPTNDEVRSYINKYESSKKGPTKEENAPIQDVLEGAGLPKNLDEAGANVQNNANNAVDAFEGKAHLNDPFDLSGIVKGSVDRAKRYYSKQADENSPIDAVKTILAAIPGIGSVMENADAAIPPSGPIDPHAMGRTAGAALATVAPFSGEIADVAPPFSLGKLDRFSGMGGKMADLGMATAESTPLVGKTMRRYARRQELRNAPGEVTPAVDPRVAELKDLTLNRKLAAEKGQLPTTEALKLNDARPAEPLNEVTPFVDPRQAELKDLVLNRRLAQEKGLMPQGDSVLPGADVDELKQLKLQRALEKLRGEDVPVGAEGDILPEDSGNSTPPKTNLKTPVAKQKSSLDEVQTFPTTYKNVKLKTPPPASKEIPTGPNPSSQITPHDAVPGRINDNLDPEILKKYVSADEAQQMIETAQTKKLLPDTPEEWQAVNDLEATGVDRVEAMKEIRRQKLAKAAQNGDPLNSRASGTNPRSIGTDRRGRNVNPRALDNMRREP